MKSRSRYESILAWVLTVVMTVTLIPLTGRTAYAAQDTPEEILSPEEVTEENVTENLYNIFPILVPLVMQVLSLLFCMIQALVFTMLLSIYVSEAIED